MAQNTVPDILDQIATRRRERLKEARSKEKLPPLTGEASMRTPRNNAFLAALRSKRGRAVIAEVKLGSPRLGSLADQIEPLQLARTYARGGAAALSVVVEPDFFHGSYEILAICHETSALPALAKDFIVDPLQLHWAKRAGASAVLLIACLYERDELLRYADLARRHNLVPLVEVHDLADLMKLEGSMWELVGINNRDLHTFKVEVGTSMALSTSLPTSALKVSESGISNAGEIAMLRSVGFDAFLIGEALLQAPDTAAKLQELCD